MTSSTTRLIALVATVLWLAGCDEGEASRYHYAAELFPEPTCGGGAAMTDGAFAIADAAGAFGWALATEMNGSGSDSNLLVSPASVSIALGMTWDGAAGATEQEMRETLGYGELSADEIRAGYRDWLTYLSCASPEVEMEYANAVWYSEVLEGDLVPDFVTHSEESFFAPVAPFPEDDPVGYINGWIEQRTHGLISDMLDSLDYCMMLLVNALYFRAEWESRLDTLEEHGVFHAASGDLDVARIGADSAFPYAETEAYQAARIPYSGGTHAMTIILPAEGGDADAVLASLNGSSFAALEESMLSTELALSLPRFQMAYGAVDLKSGLADLGMTTAFGEDADFSGIFQSEPVSIGFVLHQAFVAVTEEGTEAAAATIVGMDSGASDEPERVMRVDRPFLFVIHDTATYAPLFIGKVEAPVRMELE